MQIPQLPCSMALMTPSQLRMTVTNFFRLAVKIEVMLRPMVSQPVCFNVQPPSGAQDQIFVNIWQLQVSWCEEPSLTSGRACYLELLLAFASPGLMITFYYLSFETSPPWRARSPYLYPPRTGWFSYTPRHWVLFSLHSTTRSHTVELLEPASTQGLYNLKL
jgi:hypothetical protein